LKNVSINEEIQEVESKETTERVTERSPVSGSAKKPFNYKIKSQQANGKPPKAKVF